MFLQLVCFEICKASQRIVQVDLHFPESVSPVARDLIGRQSINYISVFPAMLIRVSGDLEGVVNLGGIRF